LSHNRWVLATGQGLPAEMAPGAWDSEGASGALWALYGLGERRGDFLPALSCQADDSGTGRAAVQKLGDESDRLIRNHDLAAKPLGSENPAVPITRGAIMAIYIPRPE
jgi:hypothetical protein